jgi:hypothetical protein
MGHFSMKILAQEGQFSVALNTEPLKLREGIMHWYAKRLEMPEIAR